MPNQITSPRHNDEPQASQRKNALAHSATDTTAHTPTQITMPANNIMVNHYEITDLLENLKSVEKGVSHALTALRLAKKTDNITHLQSLIEVVTDSLGSQLAVMQWELDRLATQAQQGGGHVN